MPDLMCINCGEPWDMDYVLHEEPQEFTRNGAAITRCPTCSYHERNDTKVRSDDDRAVYAAIADLLGDDVDGAVGMFEDFEMGVLDG